MSNDKDKLEMYFNICEQGSRNNIEIYSKLIKEEQKVNDLAKTAKTLFDSQMPAGVTNVMLESGHNLSDNYDKTSHSLLASVTPAGVSTATYSLMEFTDPAYAMANALPGKEKEARAASINLKSVIETLVDKEKALSLLIEFGLSKALSGGKSAVDLFNTACSAFEGPPKDILTSITSMIPMRECINGTIETLIRRRKQQEICKGERKKIVSICSQTKKDQISIEMIKLMAEQWYELNDKLSGGKQKEYTREENRIILNKAILFLIDFLESLDQTKMKTTAS